MIEAKKLAYADLAKYIGDPKKQKLPVTTLLSKEWAAQRAKLIDADKANCDTMAGEIPVGNDTTYLSVVDREGNMVSLIQSNYQAFGSGIVAAGTGFALHDRGGLFSMDATSPNALAGRKRPLHTIIPAFAQKGDVRVAFGIMGRMEPVAGARAVRGESGGLQNEYSGGAGDATVQQAHLQRLRCNDGESLRAECAERVDEQRSQD
jgi:gamma-glutamyltranspeptidase/glutathione hydrolase